MQKDRQKTILVIDDEPDFVRTLELTLGDFLGYNILKASGGEEGVKLIREGKHDIDAILLDIMMPDLSGPEVFRIVRPLLPNKTKIIMQSGILESDLCKLAKETGADSYLSKPYILEQVKETLRNIGL